MARLGDSAASTAGKQQASDFDIVFDTAFQLMQSGHFAAAYKLLQTLPADKPAVLINLAICCMSPRMNVELAGEALEHLDSAIGLIGKSDKTDTPASRVYTYLRQVEGQSQGYLDPCPRYLAELLPDQAHDMAVRLKVDIMVMLRLWQGVRDAANQLRGRGYSNVIAALKLAHEKLGD